MFTTHIPVYIIHGQTDTQTPHDGIGRAYASHRAAIAFSIPELRAHVAFGFCYWPWHLESLALALGPKSLALALGPKS